MLFKIIVWSSLKISRSSRHMSPSQLPVKIKFHCYSETFIYLLMIKTFGHVLKFLILSFVKAL